MLKVFFREQNSKNWEEVPATVLNFTPLALESRTVGGFSAKDLVRVEGFDANGIPAFSKSDFSVFWEFIESLWESTSGGGSGAGNIGTVKEVKVIPPLLVTECAKLGKGYKLISNNQWQTIARNIEQVAENWSDGIVGSGALNRGHTDGDPNEALEASSADNDACFGTGQTCTAATWDSQKRTHRLSNGEVIWDLSGNVREWIYDDLADLNLELPIDTVWNEHNTLSATNRKILGPSEPTWTSAQGVGQVYGGSGGAVDRSGYWDYGDHAGVFLVNLDHEATYASPTFGFRCVYVPRDISQNKKGPVWGPFFVFAFPTLVSFRVRAWRSFAAAYCSYLRRSGRSWRRASTSRPGIRG